MGRVGNIYPNNYLFCSKTLDWKKLDGATLKELKEEKRGKEKTLLMEIILDVAHVKIKVWSSMVVRMFLLDDEGRKGVASIKIILT